MSNENNSINEDKNISEKAKEAFDKSVNTRALEIELFWKRSLFFWGFIASAFIGYAALRKVGSDLSIVIGCFGMVCSAAWSLVNRGSKYWQENWEQKVEKIEQGVTGPLFKIQEPVQKKGVWLSARRYSVSKLAIALSDFTFLIWASIVSYHLWLIIGQSMTLKCLIPSLKITLILGSFFYVILLLWKGKSTLPKDGNS